MLGLLLWARPFERKSGNIINIFIQVVRVLSVVCILVFVEELGITQTTQTVTGLVLIVVQSVLTGLLAILIAVNAIILCCRENPHRKRRKELEAMNRETDALTPLSARNTLLLNPPSMLNTIATSEKTATSSIYSNDPKFPFSPRQENSLMTEKNRYEENSYAANPYDGQRQQYPNQPTHRQVGSNGSSTNLVAGAAPFGGRQSPAGMRTYNQQGYGGQQGYRGMAY